MKRQVYRVVGVRLYFIPVTTRMPLKFGPETLTSVTCARVCLTLRDGRGNQAEGWGETPLSVQWVWPSSLSYEARHLGLKDFCRQLASSWHRFEGSGDPIRIGYTFQAEVLQPLQSRTNPCLPWLAALVCNSPFDI